MMLGVLFEAGHAGVMKAETREKLIAALTMGGAMLLFLVPIALITLLCAFGNMCL